MTSHRIHMLLDRSGSMESYRRQTVDAVNGYLASLRGDALARDTRFSLTIFDSESIDTIRRDEAGSGVRNLTQEEFRPRAATPLYDAIGHIIEHECRIPTSGRRAFVLVTDGEENGSRRVSADDVRRLVAKHEREGWIFIFLGANQNAPAEAAKLGVPQQRAIAYRARSGSSATATFAAAAAVSFAYFMLNQGDGNAASVGFTESDRQTAFDGATNWQAEMEKDIAGTPSEPEPSGDGSGWGTSAPSSGGSGLGGGSGSDTASGDSGIDADAGAGEGVDGDAGDGSIIDSVVEGVTETIGSIISGVFGGGD